MDNLLTHSFLCNILYVYQTKGMNKMNKYILTDHAIERYVERTTVNTKEVKKSIMRDLKALKNKRIINVGDKQYVFYKHSKEYILQKKGDNYILLTVIKHKRGMNKMNKYILTDHAIERYVERTTVNTKEVKKSIMRDLKALKNKRIINVGDKQYVFYKHSKEYILQKKGDNYILLTVIKHKR